MQKKLAHGIKKHNKKNITSRPSGIYTVSTCSILVSPSN